MKAINSWDPRYAKVHQCPCCGSREKAFICELGTIDEPKASGDAFMGCEASKLLNRLMVSILLRLVMFSLNQASDASCLK